MNQQSSEWAMGELMCNLLKHVYPNRDGGVSVDPGPFEKLLCDALDAARKVPDGCVRQGVTDHKVLGTLPMTADGCVVGNHVSLWINDVGEVSSLRVDNIGCSERVGGDEAFWEASECYSTREAAEAARRGTQ